MAYIFDGDGEHRGHRMIRDSFGVDFLGKPEDTSFFCVDCKEPVIINVKWIAEPVFTEGSVKGDVENQSFNATQQASPE